jgi:hypothetical protein
MTTATNFVAGAFATAVQAPNLYDLLVAIVNQIETAEVLAGTPAGFEANTVILNTSDYLKLTVEKDAENRYLFDEISKKMPMLRIIHSARFPVGQILVCDMSKANLRIRRGFEMTFHEVEDDALLNLITVIGEMRLALFVKNQNLKAFVKATIATGITAITKQ